MKVYAFDYNPCVHESGWITISLHLDKQNALKAMQEHRQKELEKFNEMYSDDDFVFGEHQDWCITETEILP